MTDELRKGVLSAQRAGGQAVLDSDKSQTDTVTIENPILLIEHERVRSKLPKGFNSVAKLLNSTDCWVTVKIEVITYNELFKKNIRGWSGASRVVLNDVKLTLSFLKTTKYKLNNMEKQLKSLSPTFPDLQNRALIGAEFHQLQAQRRELNSALSLIVTTKYGSCVLVIDNRNQNQFFCVDFYMPNDGLPKKSSDWPFIQATWNNVQGSNELPADVIHDILKFKGRENENGGVDRWNTQRTRKEILIQIKQHLKEELSFLENPRKLELVNVAYRRLPLSSGPEDVTGNSISFEPLHLQILNDEIPEHFQSEGKFFTIEDQSKYTRYKISGFDENDDVITLSEKTPLKDAISEEGTMIMAPDTYHNWVEQRAIDNLLSENSPTDLRSLITLITNPNNLPPFNLENVDFIDPNLKKKTKENNTQRLAVQTALSTPDATIIKGPPGTGKTTVICEIALQYIQKGKKVLIVAPTHIAVDNVLEKIGDVPGVYPLRWGNIDRIDEQLKGYSISVQRRTLVNKILTEYQSKANDIPDGDVIAQLQTDWIKEISRSRRVGDDSDVLESLLKSQANLVCSTTIGIVGGPLVKTNKISFDMMIIDEASKSTISRFLVPASLAKKWIIVGDEKQLSPYVEQTKVEEMIALNLFRIAKRKKWADSLFHHTNQESMKSGKGRASFYEIDPLIQKLIREHSNQVYWRLNNYFEHRYSDSELQKKLKHEIHVEITNLRSNLQFQQELWKFERYHRDWKESIDSLKSQYRRDTKRYHEICEAENKRYRTEIDAFQARVKEIEIYPKILLEAKETHATKANETEEAYNGKIQRLQDSYLQELDEYEMKVNSLQDGSKIASIQFPEEPSIQPFEAEPFIAPEKPEPLDEPTPVHYPKKPESPEYPIEPIKPGSPRILRWDHKNHDDLIDDGRQHIWKGLLTIVEFEMESGFETVLNGLEDNSEKDSYHISNSNPRIIQLLYQFRMHKKIADFNSRVVYDGKYHSASLMEKRGITLPILNRIVDEPILFLNSNRILPECKEKLLTTRSGKLRQGKYYNDAEVQIIVEALKDLERGIRSGTIQIPSEKEVLTIGVITFYSAQAKKIRSAMAKHFTQTARWLFEIADGKGIIQVSIVDKFQGREKDIIFLSFTRSNKRKNAGFIKVLNRLNVATTRAREKLILIGNVEFLQAVKHGTIIPSLVKYVIEEGVVFHLERSEVFSMEGKN